MRLGIFGGTFDPPHLGHLILASEALFQLNLDRLLWVLTPQPPHKPQRQITPLAARLKMLNAVVDLQPGFSLSRVEIERSSPHFAVDTVELLGEKYPGAHLVYLLGGDSLRDLSLWHQARKFVQITDTVAVMPRPHVSINITAVYRELPGLNEKLYFLRAPLLEISSTAIRNRVKENRPYRYFLIPDVYELIRKNKLYLKTGKD